jgi:hypothetical protein
MIFRKIKVIIYILSLVFLPVFAIDNIEIYNDKVWKGLLHLDKNNNPSINTDTFLLSFDDFSPKKELNKTLESFIQDKNNICKYPARYLWLSKKKNLNIPKFDISNCKNFSSYIEHTNPSKISLIFISEDVANPMSMMGHVFFKLYGKNKSGKDVENAISFFTMINTLNLPYLALESTVLGMKGYFVLKPYKKQIRQYINNSSRNIWEYILDLNDYQIKLLTYHFWELKDIDIKYYFTGYNCATIVNDMLQIFSIKKDETTLLNWLTPKDVVKKVSNSNLIKDTKVRTDTTLDKNPIYSQDDSQFSLSHYNNRSSIFLSFLPASHTILDDNRQYSFESSLKLANIVLEVNNQNIKIDNIDFFSMKSLVPITKYNNKFSKEFILNYKKHLNDKLVSSKVYNMSYSMGLTYNLYNDIFVYNLIGLGSAMDFNNNSHLYINNEVGLIIYEILKMKTNLKYISKYHNYNSKHIINSLNATQSIKIYDDLRLDINYIYNQVKNINDSRFGVSINYIF